MGRPSDNGCPSQKKRFFLAQTAIVPPASYTGITNMNALNQLPAVSATVNPWQLGRLLWVTQPAPAVWFDPRPDRRVHLNLWRRTTRKRPKTVAR